MHYVTNICRQFYPVYRKFINEIVIDSAVIIVNEMTTVVANFYASVMFVNYEMASGTCSSVPLIRLFVH